VAREEHWAEAAATLADWALYLRSWSGLRGLAAARGQQEADRLLAEFLEQCLEALGCSGRDPATVQLLLVTQYWLIVYRKPE
jgi:hypothetical protein